MASGSTQTSKSRSNGRDLTDPSIQDLADQVETLKNDISGLVSLLGEAGKAGSERMVDAAKAKGKAAKDLSDEQIDRMRVAAEGYRDDAEDFVRKKPEMALGIAAGVGLLVGMLMARRS